jgi:signal transduction histidine kinase
MSHELRTPLNAILGFAQLMESGSPRPTPSQKRNLDQILKAGWYLLELINEILDLALIESGKVTLSRSRSRSRGHARVPGHDRAAGAQARHRHDFPRFEIPASSKPTGPGQAGSDQPAFNAIKYNKPEARCRGVHAAAPDSIRISVRDTVRDCSGTACAAFPAVQSSRQGAGAEEGTGIGLVVTKRLVD